MPFHGSFQPKPATQTTSSPGWCGTEDESGSTSKPIWTHLSYRNGWHCRRICQDVRRHLCESEARRPAWLDRWETSWVCLKTGDAPNDKNHRVLAHFWNMPTWFPTLQTWCAVPCPIDPQDHIMGKHSSVDGWSNFTLNRLQQNRLTSCTRGHFFLGDHVVHQHPGVYAHCQLLEKAGFTDIDVAWRQNDWFVIGARRPV